MGVVVDYRGYYPTYMGWAKGFELPKQTRLGLRSTT
jgi:hypothetical protein